MNLCTDAAHHSALEGSVFSHPAEPGAAPTHAWPNRSAPFDVGRVCLPEVGGPKQRAPVNPGLQTCPPQKIPPPLETVKVFTSSPKHMLI